MFSLESFYQLIYRNLLEPYTGSYFYFSNFGSTDPSDIAFGFDHRNIRVTPELDILFYDQEPIYDQNISKLKYTGVIAEGHNINNVYNLVQHFRPMLRIVANSEISTEKNNYLKSVGDTDWYYFFHGFAALDWYRNFEYYPPIRKFTKVFISFNNLFTEKRSYRLNLVSRLLDKDLHKHGYISLDQFNLNQRIKQEIFSPNCLLSLDSKKLVLQNMVIKNPPRLVIDTDYHHGALSAGGEYDDLYTITNGLFHIVTETIFYDEKLHLTEKVFKPIVARRPFFLVAAPGNLAYLKRYGFKTFDRWIDESYDLETNADQRIIKIVNEVERLCQLSDTEINEMYQEMQEVLDYNFNWFYNGFKTLIVNELVDNFENILTQYNNGRSPNNQFDKNLLDFDAVKKRLAQ